MSTHLTVAKKNATPIHLIAQTDYAAWLKKQTPRRKNWLKASDFKGKAGNWRLLAAEDGTADAIIVITDAAPTIWSLAALPASLPKGNYSVSGKFSKHIATDLVTGWLLGCYHYDHYQAEKTVIQAKLVPPAGADKAEAEHIAEAVCLARDLINGPPNEMTTTQLTAEAVRVAKANKANVKTIKGEALLTQNWPLIYAVGKASEHPPHLVDFSWGNAKHPKITLVGKGVCFDSGGLDIKSSSGMRLMKKDMGGAAVVLGLAQLIMQQKLPVRLRVLLPIVENAVASNAMRPSDVIKSRKGITVEVGNTDAEGRLILADALAEADKEQPELLIDCATLTGAARVATGTDLPAFFTDNDPLAEALYRAAGQSNDPMWRLPLWEGYREYIDSDIADISNDSKSRYAGAITAGLFLKEFVDKSSAWVHVDLMGWNLSSRPGRPKGGEGQTIRAVYAMIKHKTKK